MSWAWTTNLAVLIKMTLGVLQPQPPSHLTSTSQPSSSSSPDQMEEIFNLEYQIRSMASELYDRDVKIVDLNASLKEKELKLRSYAKMKTDLERKLQDKSPQQEGGL